MKQFYEIFNQEETKWIFITEEVMEYCSLLLSSFITKPQDHKRSPSEQNHRKQTTQRKNCQKQK